jgi:hypothetical protein
MIAATNLDTNTIYNLTGGPSSNVLIVFPTAANAISDGAINLTTGEFGEYDITGNTFTAQGGGGGNPGERTVVSGNITAANDTDYTVVATATITDPSPVEGKGFSVLVRNGTATVGGTAYSVAGSLVFRIFHSGSWANYVIVSGSFLPLSGGSLTGTVNDAKGTDIASAGTTDIAAATGNYVVVTGTTTITALGTAQAGAERIVRFSGALILTHNATSLILPTGANITTAAGDVAVFVSEGSGNWRCTGYLRANGQALAGVESVAALPDSAIDNTDPKNPIIVMPFTFLTVAPDEDNDSTEGYQVGSEVKALDTGVTHLCIDDSIGAAEWYPLSKQVSDDTDSKWQPNFSTTGDVTGSFYEGRYAIIGDIAIVSVIIDNNQSDDLAGSFKFHLPFEPLNDFEDFKGGFLLTISQPSEILNIGSFNVLGSTETEIEIGFVTTASYAGAGAINIQLTYKLAWPLVPQTITP